jgi:hypothetical protein
MPPGNYLEEGTDLPRSAAPTGAIEGTKRSFLLIILAASVRWLTGTGPVPVAECRRATRTVSTTVPTWDSVPGEGGLMGIRNPQRGRFPGWGPTTTGSPAVTQSLYEPG